MILLYVLAAAAQSVSAPQAEVLDQIEPALETYTTCLVERFTPNRRVAAGDVKQLQKARRNAFASCRQIRAYQLKRAVEILMQARPDQSRSGAEAAVRNEFDKFESNLALTVTVGDDTAPPSRSPDASELSRKLTRIRFVTKADHGQLPECTVLKSSGDVDLDNGVCAISTFCAAENPKDKKAELTCMDRKTDELFRDIVAQRRSTAAGEK